MLSSRGVRIHADAFNHGETLASGLLVFGQMPCQQFPYERRDRPLLAGCLRSQRFVLLVFEKNVYFVHSNFFQRESDCPQKSTETNVGYPFEHHNGSPIRKAEQGFAADALQRPLRCRFRARLKPGVGQHD